jgi:hypothetical protein
MRHFDFRLWPICDLAGVQPESLLSGEDLTYRSPRKAAPLPSRPGLDDAARQGLSCCR